MTKDFQLVQKVFWVDGKIVDGKNFSIYRQSFKTLENAIANTGRWSMEDIKKIEYKIVHKPTKETVWEKTQTV